VEYSTKSRAGRSLRLQMTARPGPAAPAATPCGIDGIDWAARITAVDTDAPTPAASAWRRKARRFTEVVVI
jgi:hypothetical protein